MKALLASVAILVLFSACERRSSDVQVPIVPNGTSFPMQDRGYNVIVTIDKHGRRTIGNLPYDSNDGIRVIFTHALAGNPWVRIAIRADGRAPYATVTTVILLARGAGITHVSLVVSDIGENESGKRAVIEMPLELSMK